MTDGIMATNKCEHRFMWVDLHIKHLCAMITDDEVKEELGKLPRNLARTYDQIYERIEKDKRSACALMWILGAGKLLSPAEWADGVSWALAGPNGNPTTLTMGVLLGVCQNLVVHDDQRDVMRFAHLSVREFLETKDLDRQAAEMAASACLAVLQHPRTLKVKPTAYADFTPFHRYSISYWPEHILRCDDNGLTSQLSSALSAFMGSFDHPADAYIHWIEAATNMGRKSLNRIGRPRLLNPLFAAAYFGFKSHLWELSNFDPNCTNDAQETLLYVASSQGHTATVRLLLRKGADVNHPAHRDEKAPLLAAIRDHNSEVLNLLLDEGAIFNSTRYPSIVQAGISIGNGAVMQQLLQRDASVEITDAVITAAEGNCFMGNGVMEVLLQKDVNFKITKAIATIVARQWGKEVMLLLLQRDADIEITEAIVTAAAGNEQSGMKVMEVLLQRDPSIEITEAVVITAAGNEQSGKEVLEVLLQSDPSIEVTEAILTAAAGNIQSGKEVMEVLLQRDPSIKITEAVVTAAAKNKFSGNGVMELLLQRDADIEITEAILTAAAGNEQSGNGVMKVLLQRDPSIKITEAVVTAAAKNKYSGNGVMELLLQRDAGIEITEAILTAAAGNEQSGNGVMKVLLQRDPSIEITEAVVIAAVGNEQSGMEVMEVLLQRDPNIEITEAVVAAALGNIYIGYMVMKVLLQRDTGIKITEAIVTTATVNFLGQEVLELLLQAERAFVTESSLIAAAFFGHQEWFRSLRSKRDANPVFPQNNMQCLTAAIEGGNMSILDACLESTYESNGTDRHGWTLHMVAIQSRNQTAIEKLGDTSEEPMQPMPVTRWEVNPIISQFVSIGGDGTSLVYSGNLPRFPAEFQRLMIAGSFLESGLSVKGNHPFPPGNIGKNYFEIEVLDSVESR
jgi:hypothetical protein